MRKFFLHTILLVFAIMIANAQTIDISVEKDSMLIGDQIELNIEARGNGQQQFFLPEISGNDSLNLFEIIEILQSDTVEKGIDQKVLLTNFTAGNYQFKLPALVLQPNGNLDTILSNAINIFVTTLEVDTAAAIKPIKSVKTPPFPWREFLPKFLIFLAILMVIIGLVLFLIWYKNKKEAKANYKKTMQDYFEEARAALQDLESKKLWQNNQTKEYYLGISEILRTYVEGRFGVNAMESTTDEIIEKLYTDDALKTKLRQILQQADLAKFAKFKPMGDENTKMLKLAKDFVQHTKPVKIVEEEK